MDGEDSNSDSYSTEYMQRVYQSLLKKGNNISLAELNTSTASPSRIDSPNQSGASGPVSNQSQIKQTVKIIQSNGAPRVQTAVAAAQGQVIGSSSSHGVLPTTSGTSLLTTPTRGRDGCIMGYKKRQPIQKHRGSQGAMADPYYHKWKHLKRYVKQTVFMNATVCDEVVHQEEKVARAREERRFLLRKLLHYQSLSEGQSSMKLIPPNLLKSSSEEMMTSIKVKAKKKVITPPTDKKKQTQDVLESLGMKSKPKKKVSSGKHIVPPIPLDNIGRPIFPLNIGELTLHSIGEIVPDRSGFHTSNSIFPVGYCSTRVYASIQSPEKPSLYTCKISDGGKGPMFEIVPDDGSEVFKSRFLSECHSQLLRALNQTRGAKLVDTTGKGPEFFGLSHPVVQNLIQSCPGAKKCNGYKWVKFEVNKALTIEQMFPTSEDPTISHQALRFKMFGTADQSPSSLRSLLTASVLDGGKSNT